MKNETFAGNVADRSPLGALTPRTGAALTLANCPVRYADDAPREQPAPAPAPAAIEAPADRVRIYCDPTDLPALVRYICDRSAADFFEAVADGPDAPSPAGLRLAVYCRCPRPDDEEPAGCALLFFAPGGRMLADFLKTADTWPRGLADFLRTRCLRLNDYRDWQAGLLRADAAAARQTVGSLAGIVL